MKKHTRYSFGAFGGAVMMLSLLAVQHLQAQGTVTSKFDMSIYGYVKLDASYDSQRTAAGNLMFFVLPEGASGKEDEFNFTARETRVGLNLAVPEVDGLRMTGRIETDFYSGASENSPNIRLRLAYVDLEKGAWAVRAGQDWETFIVAIPRIVNFSYLADAGALGLRRPQVRLTRMVKVSDTTKLVAKIAAARTIGQDIDGGGQDDGAAAGYPSAQAALVLETAGIAGRRTVLGLSGHAGTETVAAYTVDGADGPVVVEEKEYDSWSLIGSLILPVSPTLQLQGAIWVGENLDNYFGGIGQGINPALQAAIRAEGGWAQLVYQPTATWNLNAGYGLDRPEEDDLSAGYRAENELWFGSMFYRLTDAVTLAAEYSHLTTSYLEGEDAKNNRVQGSVIFVF